MMKFRALVIVIEVVIGCGFSTSALAFDRLKCAGRGWSAANTSSNS
jgi:hypothetical protein